jgi:uncharacterized protein (TIGR02145 family)
MKIRNLIRIAIAAAAALLVVSCSDEGTPDYKNRQQIGEEATVNVSYSVLGLSSGDETGTTDPETRTVPSDLDLVDGTGLPIKNMSIIQFNGTDPATSTMVGAPRYQDGLSSNSFSLQLQTSSNPCYTLFVANIPNQNIWSSLSTSSTFDDVRKIIRTITAENDAYVTFGGDKTLIASAVTEDAVVASGTLYPVFKRDVAKLELNLELKNNSVQIKSVRLRNVSRSIVYADAALDKPAPIPSASTFPTDITTIDYDAVTAPGELPAYNETKTFKWYVPRNQRGQKAASTTAYDKTFYAPNSATYFEVVAVKGTETSVFRVYPGANETSDFNIVTNKRYIINLKVTDIGDGETDSRVETFGNVNYAGSEQGKTSNSFIINPAPAGGGTRQYKIPVTQVNRYWGVGTDDGYGNNDSNVIHGGDNWEVSLIWSDLAALFGASDNDKIHFVNIGGGSGQGIGPDEYFVLEVPAGMPEGNFTLGIKKGGTGDWLWSWHFWVTNYNPDKFNSSVISGGVYTYTVPGGQVERYADSGTLWGGTYAKKVMMDRALGMLTDNYKKALGNAIRGNLHYQFGRKDPFPTAAVATGTAISTRAAEQPPVDIKVSVNNPTVFYNVAQTNGTYRWTTQAQETNLIWQDPKANATNKSIYDPCPPGWRMPANGTWAIFNATITTQNVDRDLGFSYGRGIGSSDVAINGLRYWPGTAVNDPVGGTIWYPAAGCRDASNGSLYSVGSSGYYWSVSPSGVYGYGLGFSSGNVGPSSSFNRASGFSVRCIAE